MNRTALWTAALLALVVWLAAGPLSFSQAESLLAQDAQDSLAGPATRMKPETGRASLDKRYTILPGTRPAEVLADFTANEPSDTPGAPNAGTVLNEHIVRWIDSLAGQKGFEGWKRAKWTVAPLGPGTHGWIVLLTDNGRETGYLIVSAAENGTLQLIEYGTGEHPLFSTRTLYRTLVQHAIIPASMSYQAWLDSAETRLRRLYTDAFHAVWTVPAGNNRILVDAKTGEIRTFQNYSPSSDSSLLGLHGAAFEHTPGTPIEVTPSDPYEEIAWLTRKALPIRSYEELTPYLAAGKSLTFVCECFGGRLTLPLPVTGALRWIGGAAFIAFEQEGRRFVLLDEAVSLGQFYPTDGISSSSP
ncbi:hypothetical protein PC41400_10380 [Paenibacillus chitinolyticus]|uniref:Uncharacterized protein n=1 Tax=Paenibacillus chitinolyticus TaxID=79263 RepID=A0A410WUN6_9BACL|nr:hypothetical protein [Paenibacillus chitinolyticus]MCY9591890.1 hypothetical protein [Paenibacillus chitinolyticus]MCY9595190.1 hypothetical protein [Paenibacillus chitinolyticus]QAV18050.1 hypothetical protein PC41400_10380 [Paenibacillus chitinolyticus]